MHAAPHATERTELEITAADMAPGHDHRIARVRLEPGRKVERWIGRCGACRASVRLEGYAVAAVARVYVSGSIAPCYAPSPRGYDGTTAILDTAGKVHTTRVLNDHARVAIRCGCGAWALGKRVYDGGKPDSKRHTCGARCTNATGPSCDCKCRGANHGANC